MAALQTDNGMHGSSGVVFSLVESTPGKLRLVADDEKNEGGSERGPWTHHVLYTFKDYDAADIKNQKLSE